MDRPKILICEDEAEVRETLSSILGKKNYEIYSASDGKEAVDKAREIAPDLIISDIRMPKLDGLEMLKEIRKFDAVAKVIFITAFDSPQLKQEASKYDIAEYLVKPVSSSDIANAVDKLI